MAYFIYICSLNSKCMKTVAVVTGDIINSKEIQDKTHLIKSLDELFRFIEAKYQFIYPFEMFRGDGLQGVLKNPRYTLRVTLLLKSGLISKSTDRQMYDMRISSGIGVMEFAQKDVKTANGRAFELSGTELDKMKLSGKTLSVLTEIEKLNETLSLLNTFAEIVIQKWSKNSAEAVFLSLSTGFTQTEVAQRLNISQSAVQQRLAVANYEAIISYIRYFENLNWK